ELVNLFLGTLRPFSTAGTIPFRVEPPTLPRPGARVREVPLEAGALDEPQLRRGLAPHPDQARKRVRREGHRRRPARQCQGRGRRAPGEADSYIAVQPPSMAGVRPLTSEDAGLPR